MYFKYVDHFENKLNLAYNLLWLVENNFDRKSILFNIGYFDSYLNIIVSFCREFGNCVLMYPKSTHKRAILTYYALS